MKNVVENLYDKYNTKVTSQLENDEFYQYYYNLLETGTTFCRFQNRKLVKEVDEEWVSNIEKALPHIQNVVDNPRKFIEEDRQIVNVAMAKKFTSESVKHLSQHSELVSKVHDDGTIEPNKVLNVFKEESLNTYENRFVYTLIYELRNFINKRIDQLYDHSKDEDGVKLDLESMVDNYTEIVNYKLELRIREKQTDTTNDNDNLGVFSRINKIQKLVNDLTATDFFVKVGKFPKVKHPIVKTNAIGKNPHYKVCYSLWNYLNSYDRIGYEVRILEQNPIVSKAFEESLYNQILMDYVVVKNHMEFKDLLNINKDKRTKPLSIKDIKQFINDVVNEYDMRASDLRNLVESELNQALSEKERREKMQEELLKRRKGKVKLSSSDEGWQNYKEVNKKVKNVSDAKAKQEEREKNKLKEQLKEKREEELREKKKQLEEKKSELAAAGKLDENFYIEGEDIDLDKIDDEIIDVMYDYMDLERLMNGELTLSGYGNVFLEEEVLHDARFSKLVRKIEKQRQKRLLKEDILKKKYEEVAELDVDKAKEILDKVEKKKARAAKKNETARLHQIEKSKHEQERAKMKSDRKKYKIEARQEKAAALAQKREQEAILRQEAKLAAEERRRIKLLEDERNKIARQEEREEQKKRRIEARKQAEIDRQQRKIENKKLRQQRKIEKANRKQQLKIERAKQKEMRIAARKEQARINRILKEETRKKKIELKNNRRLEKAQARQRELLRRKQLAKEKADAKRKAAEAKVVMRNQQRLEAVRKKEEIALLKESQKKEKLRLKEKAKEERRNKRHKRR